MPTVVDTILRALAPAMPDRIPAGHHALLGGSVVFFGMHPKTEQRLRAAEHRGRRLGRAAVRGRRVRHRLGLPGRRAQRPIEGIELKCPVLVESRALRPDSGGAGKYRGGLGIDMQVRNLVEGRWNFEPTRRNSARRGACGAASPAIARSICCARRTRTNFKPDRQAPIIPVDRTAR